MLPYGHELPPGAVIVAPMFVIVGMFILGTIDDVMLLAPAPPADVKPIGGCDVTTGGSGFIEEFKPHGKLFAPSGLGIFVSHVG